MSYNFNYPEERTNPEYKFDEIISDYNENFEMIESGSTSQKRLVATLRQVELLDPVQTDIENSIDGTIVWTRGSVGTYKGTLIGGFVPGEYAIKNLKPFKDESPTTTYPYYASYLNRISNDSIQLEVYYAVTNKAIPTLTDSRLDDAFDWTFEYIQKSV